MPPADSKSAIVLDLAEEFLERYRKGERPSLKEYVERHPELAVEIREVFPAMAMMEKIALADDSLDPASGERQSPDALHQIGDFRIIRQIGQGGMGIVYEAEQLSLRRHVALKVLPSGALLEPRQVERFEREAKAAAKLHHTNIVPVYGVGRENGLSFYVMQLIQGQPLDAILAELRHKDKASSSSSGLSGSGRAYWQSVARIGVQAAQALAYAHQQGVLHRDVKPSNLLLDAQGTIWVADFGLAKASDSADLTGTGEIVGTLRYIPPERFGGTSDARGDVYSLGLTLYELLTLRPAFDVEDRVRLIEQILHSEPPSPRKINAEVPRDLETVVLKAMAREPERRYQTAGELAADLQRFVDDQPIQARRTRVVERAWRWCRRNPVVAALTAAVVFLLVAGTTVSISFAIDATWARNRADAKAQEALENAQKEAEAHQRADREADAAWTHQYVAHVNLMQHDWTNANVGRILDTLALYQEPPLGRKDLRGWEWYYQERLCHQELRTLQGHKGPVWGVAFSPDGTRLASAGDDGTVKLWDAGSRQEPRTLLGHKGSVSDVTFSPDGTVLASAGFDGTVKLWDPASGQEIHTLKGHNRKVYTMAFSPDGARLASASDDRTARLWDVASGQELRTVKDCKGVMYAVAFSPDGSRLAMASYFGNGRVMVQDLTSGQELLIPSPNGATVSCVAFSPDGARLASGSEDRTVRLWDAASGQELRTLEGHTDPITWLAFSPDGARLASASMDGTIKLWDAVSGAELRTLKGHTDSVQGVAFSPDGTRLASASRDGTIKLWDAGPGQEPRTLKARAGSNECVTFSRESMRLVSAGAAGLTHWDLASRKELRTLKVQIGNPIKVAFSPDETRLASAHDDGTIKLWDATSGQELHTMKGDTRFVNTVAFRLDGKRLASAGSEDVKVWDVASGKELMALKKPKNANSMAFSPDGAWLVLGHDDGTVTFWDTGSGEKLRILKGHKTIVSSVAFSPDGTRLASASYDGTVKLWKAASGQDLFTLKGHRNSVSSTAFSPDGARLASASYDGTVKLWDTASGQELYTLLGHPHGAFSVAFSPDGHWLAAVVAGLVIQVWDARPLTSDVQPEVEAVSFLNSFFSKPLPRSEVRGAIQRDKIISEAARQKALELAERFAEETDPQKYHDGAWPVIRHAYANVSTCEFALAQMSAACERAPDNASYRIGLGVAQYRLGRFQKERYPDARVTLSSCDEKQPLTLAFLAMTWHQLGEKQQARTTLARLRSVLKVPREAANDDAETCLREAAEFIEGRPAQPKP